MDKLLVAATVAAALLCGACSGSGHGSVGTTNTTSGNGNPSGDDAGHGTPPAPPRCSSPCKASCRIQPTCIFAGSTDGTLNIQPANALLPNQAAINTLDGFSTNAVIRAGFGGALNPASFYRQLRDRRASDDRQHDEGDDRRRAAAGLSAPITRWGVGPEAGVGNTILEIRPSHPLVASFGRYR